MGNEKAIEATKDVRSRMRAHSDRIELARLMEWVDLFNEAIGDLRTTWQPSLALEVAFARCLNPVQNTAVPVIPEQKTDPLPESKPEKSQRVKAPETESPAPKTNSMEKSPTPINQESAPEPEEDVAEEHSGDGTITTEDILAEWSHIRAEVKLRRSQAEALLNSQRLVQVKNGVLILGFQSETVKSKMENPENIEVTRRVIQSICNVDVPIQCIVVAGKAAAAVDNAAEPDSLVSAAINLGGKLVHRD
jgi:DNA polymerase-3 subunit gamma/tau